MKISVIWESRDIEAGKSVLDKFNRVYTIICTNLGDHRGPVYNLVFNGWLQNKDWEVADVMAEYLNEYDFKPMRIK